MKSGLLAAESIFEALSDEANQEKECGKCQLFDFQLFSCVIHWTLHSSDYYFETQTC